VAVIAENMSLRSNRETALFVVYIATFDDAVKINL
jgi:hypothetical protein